MGNSSIGVHIVVWASVPWNHWAQRPNRIENQTKAHCISCQKPHHLLLHSSTGSSHNVQGLQMTDQANSSCLVGSTALSFLDMVDCHVLICHTRSIHIVNADVLGTHAVCP